MSRDKHQTLRHLTAQYRAVRAPASLTHNTLAAAAQQPVRRRWPLALASASLVAVAAVAILRQGSPPVPARSAALPTLPTLGGRLATIKPPSLGLTPTGALPSLPAMPALPAPPPSLPGSPAKPAADEVRRLPGPPAPARSASNLSASPGHLTIAKHSLRRIAS